MFQDTNEVRPWTSNLHNSPWRNVIVLRISIILGSVSSSFTSRSPKLRVTLFESWFLFFSLSSSRRSEIFISPVCLRVSDNSMRPQLRRKFLAPRLSRVKRAAWRRQRYFARERTRMRVIRLIHIPSGGDGDRYYLFLGRRHDVTCTVLPIFLFFAPSAFCPPRAGRFFFHAPFNRAS